MESYKRGSHIVWDCKYHIVWTTKYRYTVLGGDVGNRCRELLREIARSKEMTIYAGSINRDHVHSVSRSGGGNEVLRINTDACCIEDEGRPFGFSFQEWDPNHLGVASVKS